MTDLLNLPGMRVLSHQGGEDTYVIEAEGLIEPTACPECRQGLYRHGSKRQSFMDTPIHGKRVLIEMNRKRYRCKACGKTLFEPLSAIDGKRLATSRLVQHIERHCLRKTFAELSREVGVDEKTVRHIFDDYVARLKGTVVFETPEILGIDELKIIGQYRAMITNIEKQALFDMLPTRNKADLIAYFKAIPNKGNVKIVTMDMWNVYRQVVQDQFPNRLIIADRFHVVRMANNSMEAVRKAIRKTLERKDRIKLKDDRFVLLARESNLNDEQREKLEQWTRMFPFLGAAYRAKEAFHDIYSHPAKADAMKAAEAWEKSLSGEIEENFRELKIALRNWWTEIFNYYDCPKTNAYTESVNNLAKGMNRMGRGYSFEVIRARLLYDDDAREGARTTVRKKRRVQKPTFGRSMVSHAISKEYETIEEIQIVEYGAYIPTLVRKLEAGEFS